MNRQDFTIESRFTFYSSVAKVADMIRRTFPLSPTRVVMPAGGGCALHTRLRG